jgi:CspA family cold shock protein
MYQRRSSPGSVLRRIATPDPLNAMGARVNLIERRTGMSEQGIVKWYNDAKGYGFIMRERGADVFVHHASIIAEGFRTLSEGDRVSFDVVEGPKGLTAKNVVKIS